MQSSSQQSSDVTHIQCSIPEVLLVIQLPSQFIPFHRSQQHLRTLAMQIVDCSCVNTREPTGDPVGIQIRAVLPALRASTSYQSLLLKTTHYPLCAGTFTLILDSGWWMLDDNDKVTPMHFIHLPIYLALFLAAVIYFYTLFTMSYELCAMKYGPRGISPEIRWIFYNQHTVDTKGKN